MRLFSKPLVIIFFLLIAAGIGISIFFGLRREQEVVPVPVEVTKAWPERAVIGTSVEGRKIESYTFESDDASAKHLVFAGGMHGGYEWNSVMLAYQFVDYLKENPKAIPSDITVTIIPSINPDAVFMVTKKEGRFSFADVTKDQKTLETARFNANEVDLNRNFDCKWEEKSTWRSKEVSAGSAPFSEPEAKAIRDFALDKKPDAFVFWHSQANAVYASECEDGILPVTEDIMNAYAEASGYAPVKTFDSYKITGDSEGWLASIQIPAITVELKTHETVEWDKNLAGVKALFAYFSQK